jgi:predicted O-methyltransferase YrrM
MSDRNFEFAKYESDFDNNYYVNNNFNQTNYSELIKCICALTNAKSYLELGISNGFSFYNVSKVVDKAVGVDMNDARKFKCGEFYKMTTDDFFEKNTDTFDVIFIDASHDIEFVKKDFENSLKILNTSGILIFDDTDPLYTYLTDSKRCGDAYIIKDYIRKVHPELDIVTLPILCKGMSIVTRKSKNRFELN